MKIMNRFFSIALVLISALSFAQISLSAKGNLLFNTGNASWEGIVDTTTEAYNKRGDNNVGYNVGLSLKIETPTAFFVMPELYYTSFKNEFTDPTYTVTLEAKSQRIDMPVLLGMNVLGKHAGIFAGPVASYNLSSEDTYNDFKENAENQFTVGYQFGAQFKLSKLIFNARYEGAFSKDERTYINTALADASYEIRYDNRPSFILLGLGYEF